MRYLDMLSKEDQELLEAVNSRAAEIKPEPVEEEPFHLDQNRLLADMWAEYAGHVQTRRFVDKWIKQFQAKVYKVSKNRPLYLNGAKVASYTQDGNFTESWFAAEQPELHKEFTKLVVEEKFDKEAFRAAHPDLYEKYRAPTMRLVNDPQIVP